MHIFHDFGQNEEIWLFRIINTEKEDLTVPILGLRRGNKIQTDDLELEFLEYVAGSSKITFKLTDLKYPKHIEHFDFSLKYYKSYVDWGNQNSGAYIFRPDIKDGQTAYNYSNYHSAQHFRGKPGQKIPQQMDFHFVDFDQETGDSYQKAIVHVSIDPDMPILKFDVDLDQVP